MKYRGIWIICVVWLLSSGWVAARPVVFPFAQDGTESSTEWIGYALEILVEDMSACVPLH